MTHSHLDFVNVLFNASQQYFDGADPLSEGKRLSVNEVGVRSAEGKRFQRAAVVPARHNTWTLDLGQRHCGFSWTMSFPRK